MLLRSGVRWAIALALAVWWSPTLHAQSMFDAAVLGDLRPRPIGPAVMSGRITSLAAVPGSPVTVYAGAASGGVWKSKDGGITFEPVFDDHTQSVGAIAVHPSSPDTVWVGTGESWTRNSVSVGTGVYKSVDGGESWEFVGLGDSERISRIVIRPDSTSVVFVCATGHLWDANAERGVYRTTDGGATWSQVLFVDENTGCSDLAIDPQDPRILYAGLWQFRRRPDFFTSGGPGSGLYKSTDGGTTWRELTVGLPTGDKGRIAVAVAPSRPSVVYALVEAEHTAFYRSDDLGESWTETNASSAVVGRPFYFALVVVDPVDFNRVYKPDFALGMSTDGGKSFGQLGSSTHGDHHALWIDPHDPQHLILGTDGGVYISYDRGAHWRHVGTLPVSQFYEVGYDMAMPYNVYGGLQDNGTWMGPSRGIGGVRGREWRNIGFGDGFHAFPDPTEPDLVYVEYQGGRLLRVRKSTGEIKQIPPYAAGDEAKLRFNWNTPIHLSASEPGTIYVGSQYLHRSRDRGDTWARVSPDLTTNDPAKQRQRESGGLTIDNSTAENHTTIVTISASPLSGSIIWVGTDDGNLQLTRDAGATWTNVVGRVPGLPPGTWVSHAEASRHAEGTAYVTFDGHRTGDMATYVYRTTDYGASWQSLVTEAVTGYAHVIREDPVRSGLLFLGTEFGLYMSVDDGAQWAKFEEDFPAVAVHDLAIHPREHDLIIATHGRGIYILDDITPLRHLTAAMLDSAVVMLPSAPSIIGVPTNVQEFPGDDAFVGENPPEAASIVYYMRRRHMFGDLNVEIYDGRDSLIATYPGGKRRGVNRVAWPMRLKAPKVPRATSLVAQPMSFVGPLVSEGTYAVRLRRGDDTFESTVTVVPDPRVTSTVEDRRVQDRTVMLLYRMLGDLTYVVESTASLRDQARERADSLGGRGGLARRLTRFADGLETFRAGLVSTSPAGRLSGEERLREWLVDLYGAVNGYEGRPTESQLQELERLDRLVQAAEAEFERLTSRDVAELNQQLGRQRLPLLELETKEAWAAR